MVTETHSLQHIGFLTADLAMEIAKNRFSPTAEVTVHVGDAGNAC
jgi:hypothetical protein